MGSHCVETQIYILISPVYLLYIADDTRPLCRHGGNEHGDACPYVRGKHIVGPEGEIVVMSDDDCPVGVAENNLGAHVYETVDEKQPALEHFLMDKHASPALRGHYKHHAQQVRSQAGPWGVRYCHYRAVKE